MIVIGNMLGVAPEDRDALLRWSDDMLKALGSPDPTAMEGAALAAMEYAEYITAVIEQRRVSLEPRWRAALADFSDQELRTTAAVLDRLRELFDEFAAYSIEDALPAASGAGAAADPATDRRPQP